MNHGDRGAASTINNPRQLDSAASQWLRLGDEEQTQHILGSLNEIKLALESALSFHKECLRTPDPAAFCLGQGAAGIAIFLAYAEASGVFANTRELAREYLAVAVEALGHTSMDASLFSGFPGIAWAVQHLSTLDPKFETLDLSDIDGALAQFVSQTPWPGAYDFISGLAGIGLYCMDRPHSTSAMQAIESIIERLSELAEPFGSGVRWFTPPGFFNANQRERFPSGYYNLGMAHGTAGVIAFLAEVHANAHIAAVARQKCGRLLEQAIDWLLKQKLPADRDSWFPAVVVATQQSNDCKLAWCYGDAGISASLLLAARSTGQSAWKDAALAVARHAARRNPETTGVRDACFCHGSSGLAHIFNRIYQATHEELFADTARYWITKTIELRNPGSGAGGYSVWTADSSGEIVLTGRQGIIEGIAGVGLALLAAIGKIVPHWDRMFLLDIPTA